MNWILLFTPFAAFTVVGYVLNFQVNRQLWRLHPVRYEANPVLRRLMSRFGVDKGMCAYSLPLLATLTALLIFMSKLAPQTLFITVVLGAVALASPIHIFTLFNDYALLQTIKREGIVRFKVL